MSLKVIVRCIVVFTALAVPSLTSADSTRIEQIPLKNRTAAELIPIVKPLVGNDGGISGQGYLLIIRASDARIADIRHLVSQLDTTARRFAITVEQINDNNRAQESLAADGRVVITNGNVGINGNIRSAKTGDRSGGSVQQFLLVTEGQSGFIQLGQRIPEEQRLWLSPGLGGSAVRSQEWIDIATGFNVTPRLSADNVVQLEIQSKNESLKSNSSRTINAQSMATTVSVPLNEWVTLASSGEATTSSGRGTVHRTQSRENDSWVVRIKVTLQ